MQPCPRAASTDMWVGSNLSTSARDAGRWSTSLSMTDRLCTLLSPFQLAHKKIRYVLHCLVSVAHAAGVVEEAFIIATRILQGKIEEM